MTSIEGTGAYPDGKLYEDDEGEIRVAMYTDDGRVVTEFPKLVKWLALDPDTARRVGESFIELADLIESGSALGSLKEFYR